MTTTAPRWRGYTADERRAAMRVVREGRDRKALDRRIDDLIAGARLLSDEQLARLASILPPSADGSSE